MKMGGFKKYSTVSLHSGSNEGEHSKWDISALWYVLQPPVEMDV